MDLAIIFLSYMGLNKSSDDDDEDEDDDDDDDDDAVILNSMAILNRTMFSP